MGRGDAQGKPGESSQHGGKRRWMGWSVSLQPDAQMRVNTHGPWVLVAWVSHSALQKSGHVPPSLVRRGWELQKETEKAS